MLRHLPRNLTPPPTPPPSANSPPAEKAYRQVRPGGGILSLQGLSVSTSDGRRTRSQVRAHVGGVHTWTTASRRRPTCPLLCCCMEPGAPLPAAARACRKPLARPRWGRPTCRARTAGGAAAHQQPRELPGRVGGFDEGGGGAGALWWEHWLG